MRPKQRNTLLSGAL